MPGASSAWAALLLLGGGGDARRQDAVFESALTRTSRARWAARCCSAAAAMLAGRTLYLSQLYSNLKSSGFVARWRCPALNAQALTQEEAFAAAGYQLGMLVPAHQRAGQLESRRLDHQRVQPHRGRGAQRQQAE
jgi:hypothetical protein